MESPTLTKESQAIAGYDQTIRLKPDYAEAYYYRGLAYGAREDSVRAIIDLSQTIALKPDHADAHYHRANWYSYKEQYDHAISDYTRTIELRPDFAKVYYGRAGSYKMKGEMMLNRGDRLGAQELFDRAVADYSQAIASHSSYDRLLTGAPAKKLGFTTSCTRNPCSSTGFWIWVLVFIRI